MNWSLRILLGVGFCTGVMALIYLKDYINLRKKIDREYMDMLNRKTEEVSTELIVKLYESIPGLAGDMTYKSLIAMDVVGNLSSLSPTICEKIFEFVKDQVNSEHLTNIKVVETVVLDFFEYARKCVILKDKISWFEKLSIIAGNDEVFNAKAKQALSIINSMEKYLD